MDKIRVIIADDHHILLDGLKVLLQKQKDIELVGAYQNGQEVLQALPVLEVDIAVVDINMPLIDGAALTRQLKTLYPDVAVIVLSMYDDSGHIMELIDAGASAYLLKNTTDRELMDAIRAVVQGKMYFPTEVSETIALAALHQQKKGEAPPVPRLTERELEVLRLIAAEYNNAEIARTLFISERTVETHRKNMLRKTNNKTIVGLLKFAMEQQII